MNLNEALHAVVNFHQANQQVHSAVKEIIAKSNATEPVQTFRVGDFDVVVLREGSSEKVCVALTTSITPFAESFGESPLKTSTAYEESLSGATAYKGTLKENAKLNRIREAIYGLETGFQWSRSPEGHDYWQDIVHRLKKIAKLAA